MIRAAIFALTTIFTVTLARAQDITGSWLAHPTEQRLVERFSLKFSRDSKDSLSGDLLWVGHLPTDVHSFKCSSITVRDSRVSFTLEGQGPAMSFNGTISGDGKTISGFIQGPRMNAKLTFERTGKPPGPKSTAIAVPAPPPATPTNEPAPTVPPSGDSAVLLSRALEKLAGADRQLLKYTCAETIERSYYAVPASKASAHLMTEAPQQSCSGRTFGDRRALNLKAEDRIRLEVAVADGKEIDSWASASAFDSRSIHELVATGPTNTGAFGTALVDIFQNPGAHYGFQGERNEEGRRLFTYAVEVPLEASHYRVRAAEGWHATAYRGSFDLDAATAGLTRLVTETAELPASTGACRARTTTSYSYQSIGGGQYLIPLASQFDAVLPNAGEDHSAIVFSGCHEYGAESTLVFGGETAQPTKEAALKAAAPIPPGLSISLVLANSIDTATAAAGDRVTAKVAKAIHPAGSGDVLVAAGAIVHGRITAMRHDFETGQFLVAIRYESLEQNGTVSPIVARLDRELKVEQAQQKNKLSSRGTEFGLPAPATDSGTWFKLPPDNGHAVMPAGFESKWLTVAQ